MKMTARLVSCFVFCLLAFSIASGQQSSKSKTFYTEGTFSNISAGPGGDYGGMQIYITDSDGQFYATVTTAEGVLLPPVLVKVEVQIEKRRVAFTLPNENGPRKFTGTVSADGLTLFEGGSKSFLKRKCN
jgi:hypothetical protein